MRLIVVGGVAAGMSAAARARRLDESAEIIVLERGPHVSFANCGLPYFVGGEIPNESDLLVQTPQSLQQSLNLDVRVNHEVTAVNTAAKVITVNGYSLKYDALVLAPGATAVRPPIPGLDLPHVHTLRSVSDAVQVASVAKQPGNAVILGAGFIGVETAEALVARGWNVSVVELAEHVLPPVEREIASIATRELERLGIHVIAGVGASEVSATQVLLTDGRQLDADLIILSAGVRPDTEIFADAGIETKNGAIVIDRHGRTSAPHVWAAGDAAVLRDMNRPVALAGPANRGGRYIADDIFTPELARKFPTPLGTAIVRIGKLTVAMTGANRAALAGRTYHTIHLHPTQHAGYFPGAQAMSLLVHCGDDGTILGAQAVGPDGVDKRIDVLATAIRAGMTVDDLIDLDLSYAPPYGSAKDAINMAGMIGQNVLDGEIRLWYASDLPWAQENALIIDVRSEAEFASGHLPGALCVPHTQIRARLDQITAAADGRPLRLICKSGMRSYLAYRILAQQGIDVATFSGGMTTLADTLGPTLVVEKGM